MLVDLICQRLDEEFRVNGFREPWPEIARAGVDMRPFASPQFMTYGNGLLVRGSDEIDEVYTAVYPSPGILEHIRARAMGRALIVCHHPLDLDGRHGWMVLTPALLSALREARVSLYSLHMPLIHGERISTWRSLARTLGVDIEGTFTDEAGHVGCYGLVEVDPGVRDAFTFASLVARTEELIGIANAQVVENVAGMVGRVGLVPGDGADGHLLDLAANVGCDTYITGILNDPMIDPVARERSDMFLAEAAARAINLIGASRYGTEAPGLRVLTTWFQALGLTGEFVPAPPELPEFMLT